MGAIIIKADKKSNKILSELARRLGGSVINLEDEQNEDNSPKIGITSIKNLEGGIGINIDFTAEEGDYLLETEMAKSGTLEISKSNNDYEIKLSLTDPDNNNVEAYYKGELISIY